MALKELIISLEPLHGPFYTVGDKRSHNQNLGHG